MENLLRYDKKQRFLVIDTETEGLNLVFHRPFQLSWVLATQDAILDTQDRYVLFNDLRMSEGAAKITRFDWVNYKKKAETPNVVASDFFKLLNDPSIIVVCQNLFNFDCLMIKRLQQISGLPVDFSYLSRCIDTKCLSIAILKELKFDSNSNDCFLTWQWKLNSVIEKGLKTNQKFMLDRYKIPHDPERLHEALYDVTMLLEIFKKQIWEIEVPNVLKKA